MRWRLFSVGVALASFATIALELTLTRIFSVTMYYHFAFMVISIAMLGLSVAGVSIYLLPRVFTDRSAPLQASGAMLIFALLAPWALKTTLGNPISLVHWRENLGHLGVLYASTGLTMLGSGFAISLAISAAKERIGRVYAFDLLVYALRHERPALIIGPGGGTDVISALKHGVPRVVGVEVNPIIVNQVVRGAFAGWSGDLYRDPRVSVVVDEGRSYIRRSGEQYGSIQATLVDTWAASSSGAFTLSENNIYTVEAMEEFLGHLAPGGIVCITRWYDAAHPKEFLRLVALGREALERRGVPPADVYKHFVLATDNERRGTLLLNRDPYTPGEVQTLADAASAGKLALLFAPHTPTGPQAGQAGRSTAREDALVGDFLRAPSATAYLASLPYDAAPTTDDKPFFFYNLRRSDLVSLLGRLGSLEINNLGIAILLVLLALSAALTLLLVVLPLVIFERKALAEDRRDKLRVLGYFLCLGLGFILVEIGFMQTFVLFLGHPTYALAVILASLLASSGTGSLLSSWGVDRFGLGGYVARVIGALSIVLLLYAVALTPLFHGLLGLPLGVRIFLAALLVCLPGFLMGALLPCGVRVASRLGAGTVSWGWGLNGAASVVGSILAVGLSMNFGFKLALIVGIVVYAGGWALLPVPASRR